MYLQSRPQTASKASHALAGSCAGKTRKRTCSERQRRTTLTPLERCLSHLDTNSLAKADNGGFRHVIAEQRQLFPNTTGFSKRVTLGCLSNLSDFGKLPNYRAEVPVHLPMVPVPGAVAPVTWLGTTLFNL